MSDLMRSELAKSRERHCLHGGICRLSFLEICNESLRDEKILTHAERSECHVSLDNFSGSRIADGGAIRPPSRGAVDPLDDIVPEVHGIRAVGHQFNAECILVSCCLERLVPPARTLQQGRAYRLRRSPVEIVDDRFHRIADL